MNQFDRLEKEKMRSTDRVIEIQAIKGKPILGSTGMPDNRLFTGENKIHAVMDSQTTMWTIRYEKGLVPESWKQKFTSFGKLKEFLEQYLKRRNVEIVKVID